MVKQFTVVAHVAAAVLAENETEAADKLAEAIIDAFPGDKFNAGLSDIAIDIVYQDSVLGPTSLGAKMAEVLKNFAKDSPSDIPPTE